MPLDQAPRIHASHAPHWELPEILDIKIRATAYRPKPLHNFKNPLESVQKAVELVLTLKSPIPARALGPVLYVGRARLTESEAIGQEGREVRFWAFDPSKLKEGAPITMLWDGDERPKKRNKAKFTYTSPK